MLLNTGDNYKSNFQKLFMIRLKNGNYFISGYIILRSNIVLKLPTDVGFLKLMWKANINLSGDSLFLESCCNFRFIKWIYVKGISVVIYAVDLSEWVLIRCHNLALHNKSYSVDFKKNSGDINWDIFLRMSGIRKRRFDKNALELNWKIVWTL